MVADLSAGLGIHVLKVACAVEMCALHDVDLDLAAHAICTNSSCRGAGGVNDI